MPRHELTFEAEEDLRQIIDHSLTSWGRAQALRYIEAFESLAENLATHPGMGRDRSTLLNGVRSFPFRKHVLYYVEEPFGITILRVLHQRMDVLRQLQSDLPP